MREKRARKGNAQMRGVVDLTNYVPPPVRVKRSKCKQASVVSDFLGGKH